MPTVVVVTDANVLINFCLIQQVSLLGALPDLVFLVPEEVLDEITDTSQRELVKAEIEAGSLKTAVLDSTQALELFAQLRGLMGRGEAACLAMAATEGAHIASDERKRFKRKAVELLGEERILRTEDLILRAIRGGLIDVARADSFKGVLEENRYLMPFASFSELMGPT